MIPNVTKTAREQFLGEPGSAACCAVHKTHSGLLHQVLHAHGNNIALPLVRACMSILYCILYCMPGNRLDFILVLGCLA